MWYKLEGKIPVKAKNVYDYINWQQTNPNMRVAETTLHGYWISTVFLGLDHGWRSDPLLFETMIFFAGNPELPVTDRLISAKIDGCEFQRRYYTYEEAEIGHQEAIKMVQRSVVEQVDVKSLLAQIQFEQKQN